MQRGTGYLGTPDIMKTESEWQEVIPLPDKSKGWTIKYNLYKFAIKIDRPTKIKINNGNEIYLEAAFEMTEIDAPITSFKIKDVGVSYHYIGAY